MSTLLHESFRAATAFLAALDPDWAALVAQVGECQLRLKPKREPYEALIRAIAYQQLHSNAAEAILARFVARYPDATFPSPEQVLATTEDELRACGFSRAKTLSIRDIATSTIIGMVPPLKQADLLSDEELIKQLTTIRGVGRWTVEMFLIFSLGRLDILPVDDFGVREGWRLMAPNRVAIKPKALAILGQRWSPYRSIATWYLWRAAELGKAHEHEQRIIRPS